VPSLLLDYWSARRHELKALGDELIASRSAEFGRSLSPTSEPKCFQIATYRTRTAKVDADTPTEELRGHWRAEAEAWGLAPETWAADLFHHPPRTTERSAEEVAAEVIVRLEEGNATWTRAEVVEEVSAASSTVSTRRRSASASTNSRLRSVDAEGPEPRGPTCREVPSDASTTRRHGTDRAVTVRTRVHDSDKRRA